MNRNETEKCVAKGVYIRTWKSGNRAIRIEFCYRQNLCRETLRLEPSAKNIRKVIRLRKQILELIAFGIFNYAEIFPDSKQALRLGHAKKSILIKNLLNKFLLRAEKKLAYSTYIRYKRVCDCHLYPKFGNLPISELNAGIIWDWLDKFKCQRKTVVNILTPLRAIVADALIYGHLEKNPFDRIDISRLEKISSDYIVEPFNKNEIKKLLSVAEGQVKNLFQFAFFTGLRTSELIGLRWEDIDLDEGMIHVRRAIVNGKEKEPKTKSSIRKIYLLPSALKALEQQKDYTHSLRERIFHNPIGNKPWESSGQLRKRAWLPLFQDTDVPYRNLYQTRHTYASMLISGGEVPLWVSQQMGHKTPQTTSRFYTRWVANPDIRGGYQPVNHW